MNNFHYGMSLCQTLYDIDLQEDMYEEIALVAWNLIGNKRTQIYKYNPCTNCLNINDSGKYYIELPCNVDIIEAVTTGFEDWGYVTNYTEYGNYASASIEEYIESRKAFHDPLYISGKLVPYERVGNILFFDKPYKNIQILYRGIVLDDNGLPEITDKEALALATYCAYITKFKEGLRTNNPNIVNLANTLKLQWNVQCDLARVDSYLTQNDWNNILEAKNNWNRKIFNQSYKMYK